LSVRQLFADSAAFRTWVGAADPAAALLRVHESAVAANATRPFVLLAPVGELEEHLHGIGCLGTAGVVTVKFVQAVPSGHVDDDGDFTAAYKASDIDGLQKTVRDILREVRALGQSPGYQNVRTASFDGPVSVDDREERALRKSEGIPIDLEQNATLGIGFEEAASA